jgi:lipopolysaccharide export system protein LptC
MRHYPDTDTLEIDGVTIRALSPDGSVTRAAARRALSNADASEVQLLGGAQVVREAVGDAQPIEFESEFLHAFLTTERLRSHLPVHLRQGTSDLRVGGIDYDNLTRTAKLSPPVRARFEPPRR